MPAKPKTPVVRRCPGPDGCAGYQLDGDKLLCCKCRRFYGYVRNDKSRQHIEAMIEKFGLYDPETMHERWGEVSE